MSRPIRIQLSRAKGWRMPQNTVTVARPTCWGNPWKIGEDGITTRGQAVSIFRRYLLGAPMDGPARMSAIKRRLPELRGKNLACWCPLDQPCHADVLLELANSEQVPA